MPDSSSDKRIKKLYLDSLAEYIDVDSTDINMDDSFWDDLHMNKNDFPEFINLLEEKGISIGEEDFSNVETVEDLLEVIHMQSEY